VGGERLNRYDFAMKVARLAQVSGVDIEAESGDLQALPFLGDLSLVQSEIVKANLSMTFDDYLSREVMDAKAH